MAEVTKLGELLQLVGGFHDGQTVTIRPGDPIPHRWAQVVPIPISAYYWDERITLMQTTEIERDEYVPAIDPTGNYSRNDQGHLVYRLAGGWRNGRWVSADG